MKVSVEQTIEVSDERRKQIAADLGVKWADRAALKGFLWEHGAGWETYLDDQVGAFAEDPTNVNGVGDDPEEDLLGTGVSTVGPPLVTPDEIVSASIPDDEDLI